MTRNEDICDCRLIFNNKYKVNKFSLKINDNLTKDSSVIANTFNNFFSSIAQNLQTKIPNFGDFKTFVKKNKSLILQSSNS